MNPFRAPQPSGGAKARARFVVIPSETVPQGGGAYLIRPGQPVVVTEEIGTREAARLLGLSQRRIEAMIEEGRFIEGEEWTRPGGPRGRYRLKLAAVLARRQQPT